MDIKHEKHSQRRLPSSNHHHTGKGKRGDQVRASHVTSTAPPQSRPSIPAGDDVVTAGGIQPSNKSELGDADGDHRSSLSALPPDFDARSSTSHDKGANEKSDKAGVGDRVITKNLWEVCCKEVENELKDINRIMTTLGLPSVFQSRSKVYDLIDYEIPPDLRTCRSKDFLDFYVFPYLLPAIQGLIQFARVNRVFQWRYCTFNALDYIIEYLYNNNPRYPERLQNPTSIFEIPFVKTWLEKYPRKPPPKWMLMSSEEAALIIQRAVRGYMVRSRPDVQEMRQFWRDYRKDMEEERARLLLGEDYPTNYTEGFHSYYYDEIYGEMESAEGTGSPPDTPADRFHSDECVYCRAFRDFIESQPQPRALSTPASSQSPPITTSPPKPTQVTPNESSRTSKQSNTNDGLEELEVETDEASYTEENHSKASLETQRLKQASHRLSASSKLKLQRASTGSLKKSVWSAGNE